MSNSILKAAKKLMNFVSLGIILASCNSNEETPKVADELNHPKKRFVQTFVSSRPESSTGNDYSVVYSRYTDPEDPRVGVMAPNDRIIIDFIDNGDRILTGKEAVGARRVVFDENGARSIPAYDNNPTRVNKTLFGGQKVLPENFKPAAPKLRQ